MKKKFRITKDALILTIGIAICLLALVVLCSCNDRSIFKFLSQGILAGFGFVGFWLLIPAVFIFGLYLILRQKVYKFRVDITIWGIYLIVLGLLIFFSIIGPDGKDVIVKDTTYHISAFALNERELESGVIETSLQFNNAVDLFKGIVNQSHYSISNVQLGGGFLGFILCGALNKIITPIGTTVVVWIIIVIGLCLIFNRQIKKLFHYIKSAPQRKSATQDVYETRSVEQTLETKSIVYNDTTYEKSSEINKEMDEQQLAEMSSRNFNNTHSLKKPSFSMEDENPIIAAFGAGFQESQGLQTPSDSFLCNDKLFESNNNTSNVNSFEEQQIVESEPVEETRFEENPFDNSLENNIVEEQHFEEPINEQPVFAQQEPVATPIIDPIPQVKQPEPMVQVQPQVIEEPKEEVAPVAEDYPRSSEEYRIMPQPAAQERETMFVLPSMDLLQYHEDEDDLTKNVELNNARMEKINKIFNDMKVHAQATGFTIGPAVTRFDIEMIGAEKTDRVKQIQNDLASRLGGVPVRFQPVVLGKMTSGLEIENEVKITVGLRESIEKLPEGEKFKLAIPFGKDISGNYTKGLLNKFPHLLVAGTTGSGKSIFVHAMIVSLLMRNTPDELKLLLIDPKKVEFGYYREIPHLLCPNISDANKACVAMEKLVDEMERRYHLFETNFVRDIGEFNQKAPSLGLQKLPFICVFIDEYADLSEECKDIREPVVRIAQKARSAGIHLCVATQRPSVDVIDGVIKSNISTRVALTVSSSTDSSVIIDEPGAEKLLGNGDMIVACQTEFKSSKPRVQGCFVSTPEIENIAKYLRSNYKPEYNPYFLDLEAHKETSSKLVGGPAFEIDTAALKKQNDEDFYNTVKETVMVMDYVSMSFLTRTYGIGYPRAGKVFARLINDGIVDAVSEASKGSRVLVHSQDYQGNSLKKTEYLEQPNEQIESVNEQPVSNEEQIVSYNEPEQTETLSLDEMSYEQPNFGPDSNDEDLEQPDVTSPEDKGF